MTFTVDPIWIGVGLGWVAGCATVIGLLAIGIRWARPRAKGRRA